MAVGEAAGVAAAISLESKRTFAMSGRPDLIAELQQKLLIRLFRTDVPIPLKAILYPAIKELRSLSVTGRYDNDHRLITCRDKDIRCRGLPQAGVSGRYGA